MFSVGQLLNHYVFRLEVAVNDALEVSRVESGAHLFGNLNGLLNGKLRLLLQHIAQRHALDELHDDVGDVLIGRDAEIGYHYDVGMVDSRQSFGFALETGNTIRIGVRLAEVHQLQRKGLVQLKMGDAKDLAHTALTHQGVDSVLAVYNHSDHMIGSLRLTHKFTKY